MSAHSEEVSSPTDPRSLREIALAYLAALDSPHPPRQNTPTTPQTAANAVQDNHSSVLPGQPPTVAPDELVYIDPNLTDPQAALSDDAAVAQRPLPSLLRYVDNELMLSVANHNNPLDPEAFCTICRLPWETPPINMLQEGMGDQKTTYTTFLPLSPCGHWVHYRCFISLTTRDRLQHDKCVECGTQLFHWEGITTLTLAARTWLAMEDNGYRSNARLYEEDCATMESIIHEKFYVHLALPSPYADRSPDLTRCYNDVFSELQRIELPKARWLKYETQTGLLLWATLVAIKMRRYMMEEHAKIVDAEAWVHFEEGRATLQAKILEEVRN